MIVERYCNENKIKILNEYIDDGYSGSNFDRPGFQQMLDDLESNPIVNMVITKDLSRLGRNMSESSYYAERYFVEKGIRYLAINDGFDSEKVDIMTPFRLANNEVYIRDTSNKVRSVLKDKREKGEYCACPPFGYMKDQNKKGHLIPDPKTAPIVQYIFRLAAEGTSTREIADTLTNEGKITPLKYRAVHRDNFTPEGIERVTDTWNYMTVKRILTNEVYLGHTQLGKTKRVNIYVKKRQNVPKEDWAVAKDTHKPLVSQETFDLAARNLGINTKRWQGFEQCRKNIFKGIIFCKECGAPMCSSGSVYKGERDKYWYLACQNIPKRSKNHCEHGARIKYEELYNIVLNELQALTSLSYEDMLKIAEESTKKPKDIYHSAKTKEDYQKEINTLEDMVAKVYHDFVSNKINEEMKESLIKKLTVQIEKAKKQFEEIDNCDKDELIVKKAYNNLFNLAKEHNDIVELTPEIVRNFIDRIEVGKKILHDGRKRASHNVGFHQNIRIYYRFIGDIATTEIEHTKDQEAA